MGDHGLVAPIHGDSPPAVGWEVAGGAALALGRLPDNVVVEHIGIVRGFEIDAAPERFYGVANHVCCNASVGVLIVEPDSHRVGQVPDAVVPQEPFLALMNFDSAGPPGPPAVLPPSVLNQF